ncbi:phage repressor protein [Bartonella australis AUST/NH1]|uniref:Phage repressor protein n=1 Tax=Bartonella australis (strain Aust/NH1) TaxID=1094489 RepID=M1P2S5_BARAA|nr:S24 family peptidase [Bartonella australis]AGF74115.1 phage repressor protein [Bartonella australis AUST/NH1]
MLDKILGRIDKRLRAVGLTESRSAIEAGLSNSTIRSMRIKVKRGDINKGVETKTLAALAPVLKTNVAWLIDGTGNEEGDAFKSDQDSALLTPWADVDKLGQREVPLVSWVSAGEMTDQEGVTDFSDFPTVTAYNLPEGQWIALRVDGLSMNKISPPDSIIFVNMLDQDLVSSAYYVIADETGKATYKRYLLSETPPWQFASYKNIPAPKLKGVIRVIGRVRRTVIEM